jgi:hypothetical protein
MGSDEVYVDIYFSEIVNQNSQTSPVVTGKQSIYERRLTCPEVAAEDGDGYGLDR